MTMGELAGLFADDEGVASRPEIVKVENWRRKDPFDRTGLAWVSPSPNLRSVPEVLLYPAIGLLEGTNLTVGRGTDTPFEIFGAPWLDAEALVQKLSVPGVAFEATTVTPRSAVFSGKSCKAVRVAVTDRALYEPIRTALAIALALHELHPSEWEIDHLDRMLQSPRAMSALRAGKPVAEIEATWTTELAAFKTRREKFLLYR
jgi:uncharacterized protein YbbC (DUF1343 family)